MHSQVIQVSIQDDRIFKRSIERGTLPIRKREEIAGANTSSHFGDLRERSTCQAGNGPIEQTKAASKSGVARPWNGQSLLEKPPHHATVHSLSVLPRSNASAHPVCFLEQSYILGNQPFQLFSNVAPKRSLGWSARYRKQFSNFPHLFGTLILWGLKKNGIFHISCR